MKLYATVTSERASKGQGGNEYLDIDINANGEGQPTHRVVIRKNKDGVYVQMFAQFSGKWYPMTKPEQPYAQIFLNEEKGEKQKGEGKHSDYIHYKQF